MKIQMIIDFEPGEAKEAARLAKWIGETNEIQTMEKPHESEDFKKYQAEHAGDWTPGGGSVDDSTPGWNDARAEKAETIEPDQVAAVDEPAEELAFEKMRAACVEFRKKYGKEVMAEVFAQYGAKKFADIKASDYAGLWGTMKNA